MFSSGKLFSLLVTGTGVLEMLKTREKVSSVGIELDTYEGEGEGYHHPEKEG